MEKLEEREIPFNSFYETSITLMAKPDKDISLTKKTPYKTTSFKILDAKALNKILANQSQLHIKGIICHEEIGYVSEMQSWFNF